ncbi:MAG: Dps family protein [Candidatus Kapaibacteriales bacterium]
MAKKETKTRQTLKFGFTQSETKDLVKALNQLLADYHVHYQKLRNFHWNVTGGDFFDLHEQFEQRYDKTKEEIDEVAERIRTFSHTPISTLKEYLGTSGIKEPKGIPSADKMVSEILDDYKIILKSQTEAANIAHEMGDYGTLDMLNHYIFDMQKHSWMLESFLK